MDFGIKNAPATFVIMINEVLKGLTNTICYLDDLIIFSKTKEEYITHLCKTLDFIASHQLS